MAINNSGRITDINQFASIELRGDQNTLTIQTVGTYTGALSVQASVDGKTWVTLGGSVLKNVNTNALSSTIPSAAQGIYNVNVAAYTLVRVIALAAFTGNVLVSLSASQSVTTTTQDNQTSSAISTPAGTPLSVVSAATTNASIQKSTAGNLFEITVSNPTATPVYVKLYNKASAPTVGTDVPIVTITAAAASATNRPTDGVLTFAQIGKRFSAGIAMAITGGPLATDTSAAVAGVQVSGTYI